MKTSPWPPAHAAITLLLFLAVRLLQAQQSAELYIHGETPLPDRIDAQAVQATARPLPEDKLLSPTHFAFQLEQPGYVTLVVDDSQGRRVRNLVAETFFAAGEHLVGWDCLDESALPGDHPGTSVAQGKLVSPGEYVVRGIVRDKVELRYEFAAYTAGSPPWRTADGRGGWLADHSPPSAVLPLPGDPPRMLISSFVSEAGDGFVWTDLAGRKLGGRRSIGGGGGWWGAAVLARDAGQQAVPGVEAYNAAAWQDYLEIWAMEPNQRLVRHQFPDDGRSDVGGLAVHDAAMVASLPEANQLMFVDARSGRLVGTTAIDSPRGLQVDGNGRLLVLSGQQLLRFEFRGIPDDLKLPEPELLVGKGLEDPKHVALDDQYNLYISDWGTSHQVKVFAADGKLLRTIGKPGGVQLGPYDPERMDRPNGLAVASDGHLWVAENSHAPKRVSIWTLDGGLVKAMYGPPQYGGGGVLSPDKKSFYYAGQGNAGLEFDLDWNEGASELKNIYFLPNSPGDLGLPGPWGVSAPQTPILHQQRQYMTNAFNCYPTNGMGVVGLWRMRDGIAVPVAAAGKLDWKQLQGEEFKAHFRPGEHALFAWSDLNDDGKPQPEEITFAKTDPKAGKYGTMYVAPDLSLVNANSTVMRPQRFTPSGVPVYDAGKTELLVAELVAETSSSGGGETILGRDGWMVVTGGPIRGFRAGNLVWTYPNRWPSLHAANWGEKSRILRIPPPAPGLMVGTTRILGQPVVPAGSDAGEIWAITGNMGSKYLMTTDGIFVATLFADRRTPGAFAHVPSAERGTLLNDVTPGEENFWPAITQTSDGSIYLHTMISGGGILTHAAIVRVDGLQTIRRLKPLALHLSPDRLAATHAFLLDREAQRIRREGRQTYRVPIDGEPIVVDGKLADWAGRTWVTIGEVPSNNRWYKIEAAVAVNHGRLYASLRTAAERHSLGLLPLAQSKDVHQLLATGGAIELMVGTDPSADPNRMMATRGDLRLLISMVDGQPSALLCRPIATGASQPATFHSTWRDSSWASVEDVSDQVQLAWGEEDSAWELAVPVELLDLEIAPGMAVNADIGIIRTASVLLDPSGRKLANDFGGESGYRTRQRLCWHNQATGFVADAAGEAMLAPALWGTWQFHASPSKPAD